MPIANPAPDETTAPRQTLEFGPSESPDAHEFALQGRYRLDHLIGEGGMALVHAGTHLSLGRPVAIKVLRPHFAARAEVVERFLREARAIARVRHEHVVEVLDSGVTVGGTVFAVMELLQGEDLAVTLRREGAMPWSRVRRIATQLCEALGAAHAAGVVHRDVTLANCFRTSKNGDADFIKLVDFGIARVEEGDAPRLTTEVEVFGTPAFIAPEQALHTMDADARSDVYAVGVVMYALLAGHLPFQAKTVNELVQQQLYKAPPPLPRDIRGISASVEALVLRALEKDPAARFQSMAELKAAIVATSTERPKVALHMGTAEVVLLVSGVLISILLVLAFG
jgi:serine/threonine-protein kinase